MGTGAKTLPEPSADQLMAAFADVSRIVKTARTEEARFAERAVGTLDKLAAFVRASAVELADRLRESLAEDRRLHAVNPVDPSRIEWSPFRFFEAEHLETRWTQWLAALLRPENGTLVATTAWKGLCAAIASACETTPPADGHATADDWRAAAKNLPTSVSHEESFWDGRLDLVVRSPSLVAVIENKLWAEWHDSPKRLQSDAYAEQGEVIRGAEQAERLGLVLLTCRREMDRRDRWVRVTYARLTRHLRLAAQRAARDATDPAAWLELAPLLLTIRDIEQHLLGVSPSPPERTASAFAEVQRLQHELAALEVETT